MLQILGSMANSIFNLMMILCFMLVPCGWVVCGVGYKNTAGTAVFLNARQNE